MRYTFRCRGHQNIKALHPRTVEFTRDEHLTERGVQKKVRIIVEVDGLTDRFKAYVNPHFDHDREMVLRKSRYRSPRTFATDLNRGSNKLDRRIVELMRDPLKIMTVTIESMGKG